jgi:NADH-quinone oxidoreductase subunit J
MDAIGFKFILFMITALMATRKNPIHSALWMIVTFFAMAVIYLLLNAQFIAVAQVMVYAGAIMMLILFVIMMVNMDKGDEEKTTKASWSFGKKMAAALLMVILLVELLFGALFYRMTARVGDYPADTVAIAGTARTVGALLYGQYLFPFEVASILLLIGIVGAVVIAKRNK